MLAFEIFRVIVVVVNVVAQHHEIFFMIFQSLIQLFVRSFVAYEFIECENHDFFSRLIFWCFNVFIMFLFTLFFVTFFSCTIFSFTFSIFVSFFVFCNFVDDFFLDTLDLSFVFSFHILKLRKISFNESNCCFLFSSLCFFLVFWFSRFFFRFYFVEFIDIYQINQIFIFRVRKENRQSDAINAIFIELRQKIELLSRVFRWWFVNRLKLIR